MKNKAKELAQDLISFIDNSPVSYFAVENITNTLKESGYLLFDEGENSEL